MSSLKVAVRVRPFNQREIDMDASLIVQMEGHKTRLLKPKLSSIRDTIRDNYHDFTFDYSYWSFDEKDNHFINQEQVYNDLGTDVIDCAFQGYNACVFAYGQTGSGKTFTMMGSHDNPGLIPRICQELFTRIKIGQESGTGFKTHASYLEIYNERVKDLLGSQNVGHGLRVREHRNLGPYVENLSQHAVSDYDEIQECITRGNHQRTTASTNMNDTSSRSHAIFTITFVQAGFMNDMPSETVSKIHLVDLAGSERANATGATGQRLKEGAHINKSLVTLGSVISALAEQTNQRSSDSLSQTTQTKRILYIPYRDSVLTWLLKDSLGGNSKTIMIAAISPAECNYSETLSTLRYANRAKNIINKPTINEDPNVKLIRELREEINKLKSMLTSEVSLVEPSSKMLEDLMKKEEQEKVLTEEWTEKWKEAQLILKEQKSLGLRKSGVGVVLDSEMPHLIGIHNDITTGVTLYSLKEGETLIGTEEANTPQDIVLSGMGIQPKHCSIILKDGNATLHPCPQAQCWLNANLIDEPTSISQGDIILLGRTNIFRFNNPAEAAKLRQDLLTRSRLDLSRLSLITASRENLLNTSYYNEDDTIMNNSLNKIRQYHPSTQLCRDDPELQDENRKILETIENALKQLNIERVQMHEQYKSKVRKLSEELERLKKEERDTLEIMNCREQELLAKKDMLLWEKNNEKVQIDIVCRQISALQTQLDSKKRDFSEYVAKELQELQDCGKLDEIGIKITENTPLSDDLLLQVSDSLDTYSSQFIKDTLKKNSEEIKKLDEKITDKESLLHTSTERIQRLDDEILNLDHQLNKLKYEIVQSSQQTENDDLKLKKKSLKLNLKKKTTDADAQTDYSNEININKLDTLETCDTYHTANSDCSFASPTTPILYNKKLQSQQNTSESETPPNNVNNHQHHLMSDSGVCLDLMKSITPNEGSINNSLNNNNTNNGRLLLFNNNCNDYQNNTLATTPTRNGGIIISDDDSASCSSCDHQPSPSSSNNHSHNPHHHHHQQNNITRPYCIMHRLRRKMASQKALIMKNLELDVNKSQLDEQISQLQELKKKYIEIEKEIQISGGHSECCFDRDIDLIRDNLECASISDESTKITSYGPSTLLRTTMNESIFTPNSEQNYSPSMMTRSCPSMDGFSRTSEPDQFLSIPSFVLRGAGKQTHYEYEIRINLPDGRLNILRRYSRFRELHLSMKHCYGAKVAMLPFPRRELFSSNSESVAKHRRRLLELYLRRLLVICSKIPQCPIYDGPGGPGLTKVSLSQLSPFFKKGLFECGKHGTG